MIRNLKLSTRSYSKSMEYRIANWDPNNKNITSTFDCIEEKEMELPEGYLKGLGTQAKKRLVLNNMNVTRCNRKEY